MSGHTPGPWSVSSPNNPAVASIGIHDDEDWVIADMCDDFELGLVMANARLIAAAPELLAFADRVFRTFYDAEHTGSVESSMRDEAKALIAAATGEGHE